MRITADAKADWRDHMPRNRTAADEPSRYRTLPAAQKRRRSVRSAAFRCLAHPWASLPKRHANRRIHQRRRIRIIGAFLRNDRRRHGSQVAGGGHIKRRIRVNAAPARHELHVGSRGVPIGRRCPSVNHLPNRGKAMRLLIGEQHLAQRPYPVLRVDELAERRMGAVRPVVRPWATLGRPVGSFAGAIYAAGGLCCGCMPWELNG